MGFPRLRPLHAAVLLLAACGPGSTKQVAPTPVAGPTKVTLLSDAGDYIGGGRSYSYDQANAQIEVAATGGQVDVRVNGDEGWSATFALPGPPAAVGTGTFTQVTRYPFHQAQGGGMDWSGEGRGCNTLTGWFAVDAVTYAGGALTSIDLRFEQHCEGAAPALRGTLHWDAGDRTAPPGPVSPPPPGLWVPSGFTPPAGSYVHLESAAGDYVGGGATHDYTQANAVLTVSTIAGGGFGLSVVGDEEWSAEFLPMATLARLQPGYYGDLRRYPFHNPARGGLSWSGAGRGCNTLTGWFAVDAVTYAGGALTSIDLRFEQHCEGAAPALRGQIHWAAGDTTAPPPPVNPPPSGLWAPAGFTPPAGNYVHLESDAGDWVGGGITRDYSAADATISAATAGGYLAIRVEAGTTRWDGDFQAMSSLARLEPGYYGDLLRYPFHNPARGGLSWLGEGRACNILAGWFVVDAVTYVGGALTSVDLRFEQRCEKGIPALRGQLHWAAP